MSTKRSYHHVCFAWDGEHEILATDHSPLAVAPVPTDEVDRKKLTMPRFTTGRDAISASSHRLWDPKEVLHLCGDSRCVGYAWSKGRKCENPIRYDNVRRFDAVVAEISALQPDPEVLRSKLRQLATLGLCRRWHYDQVDEVVDEWLQRIRAAFPVPVRYRIPASTPLIPEPQRITSSAGLSSPPAPSTMSLPRSAAQQGDPHGSSGWRAALGNDPALDAAYATLQEEIRRMERNGIVLSALSRGLPSEESPSPRSDTFARRVSLATSDNLPRRSSGRTTPTIASTTAAPGVQIPPPGSGIASPAVAASPTAAGAPSYAPRTLTAHIFPSFQRGPRDDLPDSASTVAAPVPGSVSAVFSPPAPPRPSTSAASGAATTAQSRRRCTRTHVRRLPIEDECPICHDEEALLSGCNASELVWCRSGCGRTLHKSCMSAWTAQCSVDRRPPNCAVCRGRWDDKCDCEGCSHVARQPVTGECAVCLEDMLDGEGATAWCKDGCGKSVHKECFDGWKTHCVAAGRDVMCVSCQTAWNDGCAC
jgi:hypothetical protein